MDLRKRDKSDKDLAPQINTVKVRHSEDNPSDSSYVYTPNDNYKLTLFYWICLFAFGVLLFDLATRLQSSCEIERDFLMPCHSNYETSENMIDPIFNDTLARTHLQAISKLGNRPAGSTANEIHMPTYIINYLQKLKYRYSKTKHYNIEMTIDEQVAQLNSFPIKIFGHHMTSIYDQIKNIVVRLHDKHNDHKHEKPAAVLINCHYDSFFGGIGASDDLASCVVMLETIHSILRSQPIPLKFDLIFLFNGAEENMLQGSHAFVSQHRFSPDVKLFVNLEAAGSGGRQMIFQTSEKNPWLIGELASVLRQPLATVIGQEIFSANLIPSDTDFRIFRDFARIPGLDLAFVANGYVYHTRYDTEERIPQTCLRNTGSNLVRLALKLANSDHIAIYPEDEKFVKSSLLDSQRIVYFDFLGLVLVSYSEFAGFFINWVLFVGSLVVVLWRARLHNEHYLSKLARAIVNQVVWAATSLLVGLLLGLLVHRFGPRMAWYAIRYNVVGLYLLPLVWYFFVYHQVAHRFVFGPHSSRLAFELHRDASLVLIGLATCVLTCCRLLSSYLLSIWLLFLLVNVLAGEMMRDVHIWRLSPNTVHFVRDTVCLTVPFIYSFYLLYILYDVFIPILGRAGPVFPDVVISGLTALATIVPGLALSCSVYLTTKSSRKWLTFMLLHFSISYFIFLHCTHYGFPYNQSESTPRKQRIIINHVTRNIRNNVGQTIVSENGIWIMSLDANKLIPLKSQLQEVIRDSMQDVFCELRPYCGYPMLFPFAVVVDNSLWLTQRPHQLKPVASIIILSKVTHISGMVNVTMQISGPTHTHIYLMTPCSMRIISWSLGPDPPQPIKMPPFADPNYRHYFIYYAYGRKPIKPLRLWIMFMPKIDPPNNFPKDSSANQIEIALAAHYLSAQTGELETMMHLMPKWVVATSMASTYEHVVVDFDQNLSYVQ